MLIRPDNPEERTASGLLLPASVKERETVQSGRVMKTGPGHLIPNPEFSESETWDPDHEAGRYLPLQARSGDHALFLRAEAVEIRFREETYLIVPHAALLALVRPTHPEDLRAF